MLDLKWKTALLMQNKEFWAVLHYKSAASFLAGNKFREKLRLSTFSENRFVWKIFPKGSRNLALNPGGYFWIV